LAGVNLGGRASLVEGQDGFTAEISDAAARVCNEHHRVATDSITPLRPTISTIA